MFLALAHFRSKHPMVPPLSHRVVRKLVLAWKSRFHTFSRTFVACLPCASCDLYISLLQRHLLECDDHYYTLSWNANHIHCARCLQMAALGGCRCAGETNPSSTFYIQNHLRQTTHVFLCIETPVKLIRTHTISRYLELWHPKRPASSALCQWQGLVPAHEPSQSLPLPIMCHGDHCTSWDKCILVYCIYVLHLYIFGWLRFLNGMRLIASGEL